MKILLIEDDESVIAVLSKSLATQHHVVDAVRDGEAGWTYGSTFEYDLIVMDVELPKVNGIALCQRFREEGYTLPILLLTAQDSSTAKVRGLDAGADDYVVKPYDIDELVARIRALLRRGSASPFPLLTWGDLCLNPSTCEVTYNGQLLILTTKEYELLELLMHDSQRVLSTDEILDKLWSSEEFPAEATVRSHIRRLRHKLVSVGAPSDFIATVHGRGYYLKSLMPEIASPFVPTTPDPVQLASVPEAASRPDSTVGGDRPSSLQLQYLSFLNETWASARLKSLDHMALLSRIAAEYSDHHLTAQRQAQAQHLAHQLAGTLGTFGLTVGMQLARQLEQAWQSKRSEALNGALITSLTEALEQLIQVTIAIDLSSIPAEHSPLLLIVDQDADFTETLAQAATHCGIRTAITPTLDAAHHSLMAEQHTHEPASCPDIVLIRHPFATNHGTPQNASNRMADPLFLLESIAHRHPQLPILVVGDPQALAERLNVVQRAERLFLEASNDPKQILTSVGQLLRRSHRDVKVMVVDDDLDWLRTLPTLLQPWNFKVTTLADPEQFWAVLQTVMPDVLVLDVKMPQFNGFDLCQVLRSDLHWQQLPILFVSVLSDLNIQNQAFTVGADDYLCKPVMGVDLAKRILNRLQRAQAYSAAIAS